MNQGQLKSVCDGSFFNSNNLLKQNLTTAVTIRQHNIKNVEVTCQSCDLLNSVIKEQDELTVKYVMQIIECFDKSSFINVL